MIIGSRPTFQGHHSLLPASGHVQRNSHVRTPNFHSRYISKGYIDLSKRRVSATDIAKCEERYNKSKAVHSIMSTVAKKENKDLEALYEELAWPLYSKYGHAYDAFKAALK